MADKYTERQWLNKPGHSTGSITVFDGPHSWGVNNDVWVTWIEVKDCHSSVRIHLSGDDSKDDFINKAKIMRDVIDRFLMHLQSTEY